MLCKVQVGGVGYSKGALWVDNSKASDKSQYILVRPHNIKTHFTKFIHPGLYLRIEYYIYIIAYIFSDFMRKKRCGFLFKTGHTSRKKQCHLVPKIQCQI